MGRAIDMEKDIDALKKQIDKLENIVRGMSHQLETASVPVTVRGEKFSKDGKKIDPNSKETTVTHIDLVDDVKNEEDSNDEEKKTNTEGSNKRNKSNNTDGGTSKKRSK